MAKGTYWQRGEAIDFANTADGASKIEANDIVMIGGHLGIAGTDIAVGETGAVIVNGVFELPKDDQAIDLGGDCHWDGSAITKDANDGEQSPTAYPLVGYAIEAALAGDTVVKVKLLG